MSTVAGLFNTRAAAENAVQQLRTAGVPVENVNYMAQDVSTTETDNNWDTSGIPDTHSSTYQAGYERGGTVLKADVPDGMESTARSVLERFGSMTPDNARDLFERDPNYRMGNKGVGAEAVGGAIGTIVGGVIGTIAGPLGTIAGAAIGGAAGAGAGHLAGNDEGSNAGPMTGGASGAIVGGAIGSIGGPVGTAIGAVVGGAAGGAIGEGATEAGAEASGDTTPARDRDVALPRPGRNVGNIAPANTTNSNTTMDTSRSYTTSNPGTFQNTTPTGNRYPGNVSDTGDNSVITSDSFRENTDKNSGRLASDNLNTTDTLDYDDGATLDDTLGPDTNGPNDSNQTYRRDNLQL